MTTLRTFLVALLLCAAPAQAQTLKSLMYNTSNNAVVQTQRLTFTLLGVASGTAATPSLTYASGTNTFGTFAASQLGVGPYLGFSVDGTRRFFIATNTIRAELPISFANTTNAAETRTNLGLGATWLTNTSNVTTMRALAGSTNTNEPYNGIIQYADSPTGDTYEMTVSNGIILKIQMQ